MSVDDRLDLASAALAFSSVGLDQDVARAHLLLGGHRLDGLVVDLVHRLVGDAALPGLQQQSISSLLRVKARRRLNSVSRELLAFGRLGDQDDVGEIGDQVLALGLGRIAEGLAEVLLGQREIALRDLDAVDLGDHRIVGRPGLGSADGRQRQRRRSAACRSGEQRRRGQRSGEIVMDGMARSCGVTWSRKPDGNGGATGRPIAAALAMAADSRAIVAVCNGQRPILTDREQAGQLTRDGTPSYVSDNLPVRPPAFAVELARKVPHFRSAGGIFRPWRPAAAPGTT